MKVCTPSSATREEAKLAAITHRNAGDAARAGANQLAIDESQFLPEPGGFIFVSDNYEVDQSVPTLLQDLEYELAPLLARDLLEQAGRNGAGS